MFPDFSDFFRALIVMVITLGVLAPLAIWKLVELIVAVVHHIHWQ